MSNRNCLPGSHWDNLVNACVPGRLETTTDHKPPTDQPLRSMDPTAQRTPLMVLNPAMCVFVVLTILGSILALALWFIIYRQTGLRDTSGVPWVIPALCQLFWCQHTSFEEPQQEPLQKTEPIQSLPSERNHHSDELQRTGGPPSPCSHHHQRAHDGSQWEEGFTIDNVTTKHAGKEEGRGPLACNTVRETRIPLPATELGGTALVTAKTVA